MIRCTLLSIALLTVFASTLSVPAQAAGEANGLEALTAKDSSLGKGEVIAFFGDSITQAGAGKNGYCRVMARAIDEQRPDLGVKFIYAGISGHKVPDLQRRVDRDVLAKTPTVVFIYIGINDVWHSTNGRGTSKDAFDAGLRDLIQRISTTGATVVLATPSTIGEKSDGSNPLDAMLESYSSISRKVASDTGTTLCDLRVAFIEHLKKNNPENKGRGILTGDGVHLNARGNQFVADQAARAIAAALRKRSSGARTNGARAAPMAKSLFNGKDLTGWHADVPHLDKNPTAKSPFIVRDGLLVSLGNPHGHLITDAQYENYRLEVEYRFAGAPGNCGVLVHASTPRSLYKLFPKSIEVQMYHGNAGDFWCIVEDITVPDMVKRRGAKENWGITEGKARRILNLTDGSEKPVGEWNSMTIECVGDTVKAWVNNDLVNHGFDCTATKGQIALQAEGAEVEFRKVFLTPLTKSKKGSPKTGSPKKGGFASIFDGKTLAGWHATPASTAPAWTVEDGVIVGNGDKGRGYLTYENHNVADLELKLLYRFPGKGNSGVSIRAVKDETGRRDFKSYHADIGHLGIGRQVLGAWDFHTPGRREHACLRGDRLVIDKDDQPTLTKIEGAVTAADIKKGDWNSLHIIAKGNHFQFFINGKPAAEFTEHLPPEKRLDSGMIQLQLHDPGMIVHFKDIQLKILK